MAQITSITSESLQAQIRTLLPSQQGFGEDLQATNVITPIIDLTAAAAGTNVPFYQQQALAFGSQTVFDVDGTNATIANSPGFYRVVGSANFSDGGANKPAVVLNMNDGATDKQVWSCQRNTTSTNEYFIIDFDFTIFLRAGDTLSVIADANARARGSIRQTATVNGDPVNPSGFSPQ